RRARHGRHARQPAAQGAAAADGPRRRPHVAPTREGAQRRRRACAHRAAARAQARRAAPEAARRAPEAAARPHAAADADGAVRRRPRREPVRPDGPDGLDGLDAVARRLRRRREQPVDDGRRRHGHDAADGHGRRVRRVPADGRRAVAHGRLAAAPAAADGRGRQPAAAGVPAAAGHDGCPARRSASRSASRPAGLPRRHVAVPGRLVAQRRRLAFAPAHLVRLDAVDAVHAVAVRLPDVAVDGRRLWRLRARPWPAAQHVRPERLHGHEQHAGPGRRGGRRGRAGEGDEPVGPQGRAAAAAAGRERVEGGGSQLSSAFSEYLKRARTLS
ncbi:uncharacterized protein RHOBADRAFT_66224, partial [Rhodotorula graminis WP1]